jgi:hypothetical protein
LALRRLAPKVQAKANGFNHTLQGNAKIATRMSHRIMHSIVTVRITSLPMFTWPEVTCLQAALSKRGFVVYVERWLPCVLYEVSKF